MAKGNEIVSKLLLNIAANTAELKTGLAQATSQISSFTSNVSKLSGLLGVAFGAKELLSFGLEVSKLAGEFKGVENAFKKLAGSEQLMIDLKRATAGTVSELDLMKRAVSFSNFGLDLAQLPKLLEFATKRAAQTGQSVDYLVDSIVTGLGRKSVLILDNLGISSQQLNAEIAKTGDFFSSVGTIVDQELTKMGDLVETNVTKTERLAAAWTNFKVAIGEAANEAGVLGSVMDAASGVLDVAASKNLSFWEKASAFLQASRAPGALLSAKIKDASIELQKANDEQKKQEQVIREVDRAYVEFNKDLDAYAKVITTHIYKTELIAEFTKRLNAEEQKRLSSIENIANLQTKLNDLQTKKLSLTGQDLAQTNQEIKALEAKIKKLNELGVAEQKQRDLSRIPKTISNYEKEMSAYKPRQKTTTERLGGLDVQIDTTLQIDKAVAQLNEKLQQHNGHLATANQGYLELADNISAALEDTAVNAIIGVGEAMGSMIAGQKGAWKGLVTSILEGLRQVINGLLATAIAGMIAGESKKGLVGLLLAAVGVGALVAIWKSKVPEFRSGGYPNGLSVVGEAGPELVSLPLGSKIYSNHRSKNILNNGSNKVEVVGVIHGESIRLVNARANQKLNDSR